MKRELHLATEYGNYNVYRMDMFPIKKTQKKNSLKFPGTPFHEIFD